MTVSEDQEKLRILHLEDNAVDGQLVDALLEQEQIPFSITRVGTKGAFQEALQQQSYNVILSDFSLPGFDGMAALEIAHQHAPEVPFLFLSGTIGEERAVESLKNGAVDYVLKDRFTRLPSAILRAHHEAVEKKERRRQEAEIRQQAELLNQAQDAIFVMDLGQRITYWNKAAERIYGWRAEEAMGRSGKEMMYANGVPSKIGVWEIVLTKGEWSGELRQQTREGKEIVVMSHRTLLRDAEGNATAVLNINTDITEQKELETKFLRNQRMESIGSLAAGVAHDLNNVLAPILMATELLQDRLSDKEDLRMLDLAKTSVRRGADLVKQILQFSRGTKSAAGATVDLKPLVEDIVKLTRKTFPPAIRIDMDILGDRLPVTVDATQAHQVLLNLCVNARDAMPKGGTLAIRAQARTLARHVTAGRKEPVSGQFIELTVSDTGTGMPPEVKARVFEPFFTTKAEGKGTGLGLSTVMTILKNHGGFVELESEPGRGTTFRIFFPAAEHIETGVPAVEGAAAHAGNGEFVLLVDDEQALIEMTREILEANNYKVRTANNGHEALACFEEHPNNVAVLITDLLMPGMTGPELIAKVSEKYPRTITICLSGSADDNWVRPSELGANAVLRKPCPTQRLLAVMHSLLAERRAAPAPAR